MTRLLDRAVERARTLSPETQDEYASVLLRVAGDDEGDVSHLMPEEEASLAKWLEQAGRGACASDGEVRAMWAKHGL